MRKPFVAGNWKMNKTISQGVELAKNLAEKRPSNVDADIAVIPPFLAIPSVARALEGTPIRVGAQDVYWEESGAFTGEISCGMLRDAGCSFALVGHSERRHVLGETDEIVRKKLDALLAADMDVILCVGETLEEREADQTNSRLDTQVKSGLQGVSETLLSRVTVAYEPVWAIGTGRTATEEQAQQAHAFIRGLLTEMFGQQKAQAIRIQYGGSVKPSNAKGLLSQPDVDGALVGGAALDADSFTGIIEGARR